MHINRFNLRGALAVCGGILLLAGACPGKAVPLFSTNNIVDWQGATNAVTAGRWSYLGVPDDIAQATTAGPLASQFEQGLENWTIDGKNPNYVWMLRKDGAVYTDTRDIIWNYTVNQRGVGDVVISGTFAGSGDARLRIYKTTDTNSAAVELAKKEVLFDSKGPSLSFKVSTTLTVGNDVLFVCDDFQSWWEAHTLNATIAAAPPVALAQLTGPAHTRWGTTLRLGCTLANLAKTPLESGTVSVAITRRGAGKASKVLTTQPLDEMPVGAKRELELSVMLPAAPDALGNADGDYDLLVSYQTKSGIDIPLESHPIHVETRTADGTVQGRYVPRNYDLVAANSAPARTSPDWLVQMGIRHSREDCGWGEFEPEEGKWNDAAFGPDSRFGSLVLQARKYHMTLIPLLSGIPEWAQARDAQGKPRGWWGPPADPAKWAAFVDKVVGYYSQAPYSQQDWQVWNEAQMNTGFWTGDNMEQFISQVYIPAAQAIRKHYVDKNGNGKEDPGERCRVVYGGYPCSNWNDGSYVKILDIQNCGELTDILDAHYMQDFAWFADKKLSGDVYTKWITSGKMVGVWQTEEGDTSANDPTWTPYKFFNMFGWALANQWTDQDKYRCYFFHYAMAQDDMGFFWFNTRKWPNGFSMATLLDVTRGDLALLGVKRDIRVNGKSIADANCRPLLAGGRLVALFRPVDDTQPGQATMTLALKPGESIATITRVSIVKGVKTAVPFTVANGRATCTIAWQPVKPVQEEIDSLTSPYCYLVIEGKQPFTVWP